MKRFNIKLIWIIILVGILLSGCSKFNLDTYNAAEEDDTTYSITLDPKKGNEDSQIGKKTEEITEDAEVSDNSSTSTVSSASATPTPAPIQPTATKDLPVYTVNAEDGEIIPVIAAVPEDSEITPDLIVDTVVESMADQSIIVGIKNVTPKDDAVIVNFDKDETPYTNNGSSYEAAILDAIAQSIIDNLDNYKKVIYRVNDGAYVSGVFEYGIDEPHLEDN